MNIRNIALTLGLFVALAIPAAVIASDTPLVLGANNAIVVAKDEAKCDICLKKLTESCDSENKNCVTKNDPAACKTFYDKCKASVKGRCGGPTMCD